MMKKVADMHVGDHVVYAGDVVEIVDLVQQVRMTFATGAEAIFSKNTSLEIKEN